LGERSGETDGAMIDTKPRPNASSQEVLAGHVERVTYHNERIAPSPAAISRMEETFTWLTWLERDDARIVWLRAENVPWKPICWRVGLSRKTAWQRWVAALVTVSNRLSTASKRTAARHDATGIAANRRSQRGESRACQEISRTIR
jgi:Domain of unknown function (DUF6362)